MKITEKAVKMSLQFVPSEILILHFVAAVKSGRGKAADRKLIGEA